jgi:hypothetical protein
MVTDSGIETARAAPWRETQWMRRVWWVALAVGGITLLSWIGFVQQIVLGRPFGSNPGSDWSVWLIWLGFGIAFPLLFWFMRLTVEVSPEAVQIRYVPLRRRTIPLAEIQGARARQYNPLLEYGGWGIRGWGDKRAYSTGGNRGVELVLTGGSRVMIGSDRADEMVQAISDARSTQSTFAGAHLRDTEGRA